MIALDTNVLVRFLVEDDQEQTQRTADLIKAAIEKDEALYVSDIVLVETVWVLRRFSEKIIPLSRWRERAGVG